MENNAKTYGYKISAGLIKKQRWFLNKSKSIGSLAVRDFFKTGKFVSAFLDVRYKDKKSEMYFFPFIDERGKIKDCLNRLEYHKKIFKYLNLSKKIKTKKGCFVFKKLKKLSPPRQVAEFSGELSNTVIFVGKTHVIKIFRKQAQGLNPELEVLLKIKNNVPEIVGYIDYIAKTGEQYTVSIIEKYVPNVSDAWNYLLKTKLDNFSGDVKKLAETVAGVHCELSDVFGAEDFGKFDTEDWYLRFRRNVGRVFNSAPHFVKNWFLKNKKNILNYAENIFDVKDFGKKIRIHGDLHLGQILKTKTGFCVIDFQGEPLKSYAEARQKQSPLKDVAGMLRSFDYLSVVKKEDAADVKNKFINGYFSYMKKNNVKFLPADVISARMLVSLFQLEKAVYELEYEMKARPDWVNIPMQGIKNCLYGS